MSRNSQEQGRRLIFSVVDYLLIQEISLEFWSVFLPCLTSLGIAASQVTN